MDYQKLKDDFLIRFNTNRHVECFFSGTTLFLLGGITPGFALTTSLSAGTAILYAPSDNNLFYVQSSDSNISYSCSKDKLLQYHEDNFAKDVFHALSYLSPNLLTGGANFLVAHNSPSSFFHNTSGALCLFFSRYFSKSPQSIAEKIPFSLNDSKYYINLISSMTAKRNHAELYDKYSHKSYPLPVLGYKIVIITANLKKVNLRQKAKDAFERLQSQSEETLDFSDISREMLFDISAQDKQILDFCLNEKKRIHAYPQVSSFSDFCNLINASSFELLKILKSKDMKILADCVSSSDVCAFRPTFDAKALYCIVADALVDRFIMQTGAVYEKKAGFKPAFYVCDTITH